MKTKWAIFLCCALLLIPSAWVLTQELTSGTTHACPLGQLCASVERKHYLVRHGIWDGIPFISGSRAPDPDFVSSEEMPLADSARALLHSTDARFQTLDVNGAFNDQTSEVLLLLGSAGKVYEYRLEIPLGSHVTSILGTPMLPEARIVPYQGKLYLVECFFGPAKGAYQIKLPLENGQTLKLIPVSSEAFEHIAQSLKELSEDRTLKDQFCHHDLAFASMWEKYVGSCGWTKEEYEANPHMHDYDSFWRTTP